MDSRRTYVEARERRRRQKRRRLLVRWVTLLAALAVIAIVVAAAVGAWPGGSETSDQGSAGNDGSTSTTAPGVTSTTAAGSTSTTAVVQGSEPGDTRVPGTHYGPINTTFSGLTMFRGNGSRTYYGEGPVPSDPKILWKFGPMSGSSTAWGETKTWTGTGWTGQPSVFERAGKTWVVFGAYDKKIHFLDAETGERLLSDVPGGDIYKGSITVDPDGYPLVFMGCRDNYWRVIAIDRDEPTVLWKMYAYDYPPKVWNDDWDGNAVIRNDYAFVPGENSHFFIVRLNRSTGSDGLVHVDPKVVLDFPGWTQALFDKIGDKEVSIENSPALVGDRVYFSNSGGLIHGLDVSATLKELAPGEASLTGKANYPEVFKYWAGDDTDASIVVDDEGYLYVGIELQRFLPRAEEVGQIIKLDPRKSGADEDPLVWSVKVTKKAGDGLSGVWATPCLYKDMVYEPTHSGALLGIDRFTGDIVWKKSFTEHAWSSAVVVDATLIVGDTAGVLHAYDVSDTRVDPPEKWRLTLPSGGAIESTPTVYKGRIYVGSRDGYFYCFGDE